MKQLINVIAAQDITIFPNELVIISAKTAEEIPEGYIALVAPISTIPSSLRISNPTVFSSKFDIAVANFEDGRYWDGIIGDLHGNLIDIDDEILPKGFFGNGERYSIPYDIKKGDVIAIATIIKNGKQKRGGENND